MKMGFMSGGFILGLFFMMFGLSIIVKVVFNIHIPVFRVLFGLFIICFGIRMIMGNSCCQWHGGGTKKVFSNANQSVDSLNNEYNVLFGYSTVDLTKNDNLPDNIEINTIFGKSDIVVSKNIPLQININAAFSGVQLPDGNLISFGERIYRNKACSNNNSLTPITKVKLSVIFGGCTIIEK